MEVVMIGRSEWFIRRKYTGWGLTPKTWQGWSYVAGFVGLTFLAQSLVADDLKFYVVGGLVTLLLIDVLHIMAQIKLDEREAKIEAIAERNASWTMVTALALETVYTAAIARVGATMQFVPMLVGVMIAGMVAKSASYFYLKNKEL